MLKTRLRSVAVESLTPEAFAAFGAYCNLSQPSSAKLGAPPIEFYRDALPLELNGKNPMFSTCLVHPRPMVIDVLECHTSTGEGILPLTGDVLVQVAPATHPNDGVPLEAVRVFRVPMGTMLTLRAGVWHHAPFALTETAAVQIVLPERTYANDCTVVSLSADQHIEIVLPSIESQHTRTQREPA
jgi:ureidoglycolate lyase